MFSPCVSLVVAPELNTSNVTNMSTMFYNDFYLTTVPIYNTASLQTMRNAFVGCHSLTNDSLNNILTMCANATNYTETKTLKELGFSSETATTCTGLSNWSAAQAAGWTTGY